jgi:hypothetical protein
VQWCGRIQVDDTSTYPTTDACIIECGPLDQHHATRHSRAITLIPNTPGQSSGRGAQGRPSTYSAGHAGAFELGLITCSSVHRFGGLSRTVSGQDDRFTCWIIRDICPP